MIAAPPASAEAGLGAPSAAPGVATMAGERRRGLDPRTTMLLAIVCSAVVLSPIGMPFFPAAMLLAVGLALWERAWARSILLPLAAAAMWAIGWLLPLWWPNPVTVTASLACVFTIRFLAAAGIGMHVAATTSPTALAAAFRAWRIPRAVSVTLAVMIRFFPMVAAESRAVLDAMRLRGLTGLRGMVRHPILSIERFVVPMIAASLRASEDLSSSALLRGLGSRGTPTSIRPPRFGAPDLLVVALAALLAAVTLALPWRMP